MEYLYKLGYEFALCKASGQEPFFSHGERLMLLTFCSDKGNWDVLSLLIRLDIRVL